MTHYADNTVLLEAFRREDGSIAFARKDRLTGTIAECEGARVLGVEYEPLTDPFTTGGIVVLPPPPHSEAQDTRRLFDDVSAFASEYVTWSPEFQTGAVAFVMATCVYDRFDWFPYLQFVGPPGSGKTRSLEVLAALCYHPFTQSSPTPAVLYRVVSRYHPTLIVDEVDCAMRPELREVLRLGSSRGKRVARCRLDDFEPEAYLCYGPKVYAGQEPITDAAFASRIIQENMADVRPGRQIGPTLPEDFEARARGLRSRLLRWALDNYWTIMPRDPGGDDLRQRQDFLPLFTVTPPEYHVRLRALMARQHAVARKSMADTLDGEVVAALRDMDSPEIIRPIEVARTVSQARGVDFDNDVRNPERVSPEKVGRVLKRLGITDSVRDSRTTVYRAKREVLERLYRTYLSDPAEPLVHVEHTAPVPFGAGADLDNDYAAVFGNRTTEEGERQVSDLGDDQPVPLPEGGAV